MNDGNPGEIDFGSSYRESTVLLLTTNMDTMSRGCKPRILERSRSKTNVDDNFDLNKFQCVGNCVT